MSKEDAPGKKFLSNFLNLPYGKKTFGTGINIPDFGISEMFDTNVPQSSDSNKTKLGDSYNREQYNKDFRNMLITDSALRQYELGREANRNMRAAQQYYQMAGAGQESAARRRLMEDQFSPTKISQQRLRAQTGEATLMDAVARQGNTAVNIATAGLAPRGRAGGR